MTTATRVPFTTSRAQVLTRLAPGDVTIREIAIATGLTERRVTEVIEELRGEGYIEVERVGRRNRYTLPEKGEVYASWLSAEPS
jgi:predicted transcriptional regulator